MARTYEIRDPVHGFAVLSEWERDIIDHPVFQRLRRINQLGWTDVVYPGAAHTRFEHSLGETLSPIGCCQCPHRRPYPAELGSILDRVQGLAEHWASNTVGFAPVTQSFANEIGADGYGVDPVNAVELAKAWTATD